MAKEKIKTAVYSIIVPAYNEEETIKLCYDALTKTLSHQKFSYEIIFVNDGSTDRSYEIMKNLSVADERVNIVSLPANCGQYSALCAGIKSAKGKGIITFDCDLQFPAEKIVEMIEKFENTNAEIVSAKRKNYKVGFGSKVFAKIITGFSCDFLLISSNVAKIINESGSKPIFLRTFLPGLRLPTEFVEFECKDRIAGGTKYKFKKKFSLAANVLWKEYNPYLIVCGIIAAAMMTIFLITQTFPFGTEKVFVIGDSYEQLGIFFESIFDIFAGRRPELFSFYDVGGEPQLLVNILYACINPFYVIFLLCGEKLFWYAIGPVIMLQLLAIGIAALIFIRKNFPAVNKFYQIIFSLLYVFSAHFFSVVIWINWIQFALYLPLAVMAFQYMLKTGKILWFTAALSMFPIACFGVGSYSLIYLFPIFTAYILIVIPKEERKRGITKLCLSYTGAVIFALPVLVPALIGVAASCNSGQSFFDMFNAELSYGVKWSYLLSDLVFIVYTIQFLIRADYKNKFNKFLLFALVMAFLPIFFDPIERALNIGSYNGFGSRFHFINVFVLFLISLRFISGEGLTERNKFKNWCVKNRFVLSYLSVSFLIGIFTIMIADEIFYKMLSTGYLIDSNLRFVMFILFTFSMLILINVINIKLISQIFLSIIAVVMCQYGLIQNYTLTSESKDRIINFAKDIPLDDRVAYNDTYNIFYGERNNFSLFSSTLSEKMADSYELLGTPLHRATCSNENLFFMSTNIVNFNYIINNRNIAVTPDFVLEKQDEKSYLYKNTLSLGNAYFLNDIDFSSVNKDMGIVNKQNKMFRAFGGSGDIVKEIAVEVNYTKDNNSIHFNIPNAESNAVVVNMNELPSKYEIKKMTLNGEVLPAGIDSGYLGFYIPAGGNLDAMLEFDDSFILTPIIKNDGVKIQVINYDKIAGLMREIQERTKAAKLSADIGVDTAEVTFEKTAETKYLVMPYFNFDGITAVLNGKKVEMVANDLNFIAIDLTGIADGNIVLNLQYKNPYTAVYIITAAAAPILFVLFMLFNKFLYDKTKKILEPLGYNGAMCLAFAIMVMFFVIPIIYFIALLPTAI